jgi:hypothetical protein
VPNLTDNFQLFIKVFDFDLLTQSLYDRAADFEFVKLYIVPCTACRLHSCHWCSALSWVFLYVLYVLVIFSRKLEDKIIIAIYSPMIYTTPYVMFLMRADPLQGQVGVVMGVWLFGKPFHSKPASTVGRYRQTSLHSYKSILEKLLWNSPREHFIRGRGPIDFITFAHLSSVKRLFINNRFFRVWSSW